MTSPYYVRNIRHYRIIKCEKSNVSPIHSADCSQIIEFHFIRGLIPLLLSLPGKGRQTGPPCHLHVHSTGLTYILHVTNTTKKK